MNANLTETEFQFLEMCSTYDIDTDNIKFSLIRKTFHILWHVKHIKRHFLLIPRVVHFMFNIESVLYVDNAVPWGILNLSRKK